MDKISHTETPRSFGVLKPGVCLGFNDVVGCLFTSLGKYTASLTADCIMITAEKLALSVKAGRGTVMSGEFVYLFCDVNVVRRCRMRKVCVCV